jgi:hypothetical protein
VSPKAGAVSVLALALASGCTQRALVATNGDAAVGPPPADAWISNLGPIDGPGYVDGRLHAHAVIDYVKNVFWFGGSDDPSRIEIWIFQDGMGCDVLSQPGWITKVRPTDLMGITVGGNKPGTYAVLPEKPPRAGAAYLLHVIDQADPIIESEGQSGTVVITTVKPGESVSGALDATFSTGTLQGQFNATWCPTGVGL